MRKWEQWCQTWDLQRREDAGENVGEIPVPPKYTSADFQPGVWTHRGKLDVPKERFISYPGAESETDRSLVVGSPGRVIRELGDEEIEHLKWNASHYVDNARRYAREMHALEPASVIATAGDKV